MERQGKEVKKYKLTSNIRFLVSVMRQASKASFVFVLLRIPLEVIFILMGKRFAPTQKRNTGKFSALSFRILHSLDCRLRKTAQYDEKKVRRCLRDTGLEEWADQLKNGLNEWMSAMEGTAPSGGEKQRLALARAQYRDPSLMLLDEPTAALDPVAESEIFKKCREITGSTSAVYISHRLSACRFSDRILVFDDGHIIQEGHHDELVQQKGTVYDQLWQAQAQYYT